MKPITFVAALALAGCASAGAMKLEYPADRGFDPSLGDVPVLSLDLPRAGHSPASAPAMAGDLTRPDRKVIFNASLSVQVADAARAERDMRKAVDDAKGWIHKIDGTVFTLRVPAPLFDAMLDKLAALGRVLDRKVAGTDVTEEYRDLELRLRNAEEVRKRLIALLEKAKDVKETLEVERELGRLSEEIERFKGKLQAMTAAVEHSTIVVSLLRTAPLHHVARGTRFPFEWVRKLGVDQLMEFRR